MKNKFEIEKAFESSDTEEETTNAINELRPKNNMRIRKFMDIEKLRDKGSARKMNLSV